MSKHSVTSLATSIALALTVFASGASQAAPARDYSKLMVPAGSVTNVPPPIMASRRGEIEVAVRLTGKPLAAVAGSKQGTKWSRSKQKTYLAQLETAQSAVMSQISALGGTEIARVSKAHNAVIVSIDAKKVPELTKISGVAGVRRVINYEHALSDTVPYIGASAVQSLGVDGTGVRVAVLDSGIDYTHFNFGGPGTVEFYETCYEGRDAAPVGDCATYFGPGASKVVGGFDFVGEVWPSGDRSEDPNPIDFEGHGTHVADIIAGRSADGTHKGVAPGASLYGVKVCSAVASSCNGIALLKGMDFALDPNGDGDISDAVDVINMSLGSSYGQREDDLSAATSFASKFGVTVVVSAGNSADRPFITGSPSTTPEAISVAQTAVPSAVTYALQINSPAAIVGSFRNTNTVDWAPITTGFTGDVIYTADLGSALACAALPAGSLVGKVALIDRGACAISIKVHNAAVAGAIGVVIANSVAGDPPTFSFGGPDPFVPAQTIIITQANGTTLKANKAGLNVTVSAATATSLAGSVVASSSRGPSYSYGAIKPEIGAPGASVSAVAGSGNGEGAFGGTSGAAPMVSGSAALLLQAEPSLRPHEVKARLVNSAEKNVFTNPVTLPGVLAPITRIGGGEVRVDNAVELTTAMWDAADPAGVALSFGAHRSTGVVTYRKKVLVRNYSPAARSYTITPSFRYADDQASGAASISAPASVAVPANGTATFTISLRLDPSKAANWPFANNGGALGNGPLLNGPEIDGYLTLSDGTDTLSLPWHILPHKASNVVPATTALALGGAASGVLNLANTGAATAATVDVYSLGATSPQINTGFAPRPGDNYAIIDLKSVGTQYCPSCAGPGADLVLFAINTWGSRSHPNYPAEFDVYIDTNNDGEDDFVLYTIENGGFAATGQNVVTLLNLNTGTAVTRFFSVSDLSSSNMIMLALLSDLKITSATKISYQVFAFDNYFTGNLTDVSDRVTVTLGAPRFFADEEFFSIPAGGAKALTINRNAAGDAASPSQSGLLLMYYDGKTGAEASAITVTP
jgi:subtilisin family serine protease